MLSTHFNKSSKFERNVVNPLYVSTIATSTLGFAIYHIFCSSITSCKCLTCLTDILLYVADIMSDLVNIPILLRYTTNDIKDPLSIDVSIHVLRQLFKFI